MKALICLCSITATVKSNAQDSIVYKLNQHFRVIDNSDYNYRRVIKKINDTTWEQMDYFRIGPPFQQIFFKDKDLRNKNGKYSLFDGKGKIAVTGSYYNNQPVRTWYFYNKGKNNYSDSLDYDFYTNLKSQITHSQIMRDTIRYNPETEKEAMFPGGDKAWKRFLTRSFDEFSESYPSSKGKEIIITFMIGKTGKVTHVYPVKSIEPIVDLEIVKLIRSSPDWNPAEQGSRRVISIITQPINF